MTKTITEYATYDSETATVEFSRVMRKFTDEIGVGYEQEGDVTVESLTVMGILMNFSTALANELVELSHKLEWSEK